MLRTGAFSLRFFYHPPSSYYDEEWWWCLSIYWSSCESISYYRFLFIHYQCISPFICIKWLSFFYHCTNPRRVTIYNALSVSMTTSLINFNLVCIINQQYYRQFSTPVPFLLFIFSILNFLSYPQLLTSFEHHSHTRLILLLSYF